MPKSLLSILLILLSISVFSQVTAITEDGRKVVLNDDGTFEYVEDSKDETSPEITEDFYIGKHKDEMSDRVYFYCSSRLICQENGSDKGFAIDFSLEEKSGKVKINGLSAIVVGLECLENVKVFFLFEDDSKFEITNWNDFNCKGNAWFNISSSQLDELRKKPLKKIRVQNGRNYTSYTHELTDSDKLYFINIIAAIDSQKIIEKQLK